MITTIWGLNSPTSGHHLGPIVVAAGLHHLAATWPELQAEQSHESLGEFDLGSVSKILRDPLMLFVSGYHKKKKENMEGSIHGATQKWMVYNRKSDF